MLLREPIFGADRAFPKYKFQLRDNPRATHLLGLARPQVASHAPCDRSLSREKKQRSYVRFKVIAYAFSIALGAAKTTNNQDQTSVYI